MGMFGNGLELGGRYGYKYLRATPGPTILLPPLFIF